MYHLYAIYKLCTNDVLIKIKTNIFNLQPKNYTVIPIIFFFLCSPLIINSVFRKHGDHLHASSIISRKSNQIRTYVNEFNFPTTVRHRLFCSLCSVYAAMLFYYSNKINFANTIETSVFFLAKIFLVSSRSKSFPACVTIFYLMFVLL